MRDFKVYQASGCVKTLVVNASDVRDYYAESRGAIANFYSPISAQIISLTADIKPTQEGQGTPSPTNIRPIIGRTGCNIFRSGEDTSYPTTYPVSWQTEAGTVYGGTLTVNEDGSCDIVSNKLIIDLSTKTYDVTSYPEVVNAKFRSNIDDFNASPISGILSNCLQMNANPSTTIAQRPLYSLTYVKGNYYPSEIKLPIDYNTNAKVKAFFADVDGNGTRGVLVLNRASPVTYHLDSLVEITTFTGENNIWTDCGDIAVEFRIR